MSKSMTVIAAPAYSQIALSLAQSTNFRIAHTSAAWMSDPPYPYYSIRRRGMQDAAWSGGRDDGGAFSANGHSRTGKEMV